MIKVLVAIAIYFGEVATLRLLAESEAAYEGWGFYLPAPIDTVAVSCLLLCATALLLSARPTTIRDFFYWWAFVTILVPAWVIADWTRFFPIELRLVVFNLCRLAFFSPSCSLRSCLR